MDSSHIYPIYFWYGVLLRLPVNTSDILSNMKKVEADRDWDGISSAIQIKMHYPDVKVNISDNKSVPSDSETLVLDKGTYGDGWVIDHHPINLRCKNLLNFCETGDIPTSTLTYRTLPVKNETDLFLSATAEITDGLYDYGSIYGNLNILYNKDQTLFRKTGKKNQFMVDKEIYSVADMFGILSTINPENAFRLGLDVYNEKPKDSEELKILLNQEDQRLMDEYFHFMANFPEDLFEDNRIGGYPIKIADAAKLGKFSYFALARARKRFPGNYILFKGKGLSIRTEDLLLFKDLIEILDDKVALYGGRKDWHGITLKNTMSYQDFLDIMNKSK